MRKFTINCSFGGTSAPFTIYIGAPEAGHHPLHFQSDWLSKERGGTIPQEVMDSLQKLLEISKKNNVPFEDLCAYAIESAQLPQESQAATPPTKFESKKTEASEQSTPQP